MDINNKILKYLQENKISQSELSKISKILPQNLNRLLNANDIKLSQLSEITKGLNLPITYFFDGKENVSNEEIEGYKRRIAELEESLKEKTLMLYIYQNTIVETAQNNHKLQEQNSVTSERLREANKNLNLMAGLIEATKVITEAGKKATKPIPENKEIIEEKHKHKKLKDKRF